MAEDQPGVTDSTCQSWRVNVLVSERAKLRYALNDDQYKHPGFHWEINAEGDYRMDLSALAEIVVNGMARGGVLDVTEVLAEFRLAARIEDGEIIMWLEPR